jgi:predicted Fe-S protein YdhL (DUF1289 family)
MTPCINICRLNKNVCVGCGRTSQQIKKWIHYTDEEKIKIMNELIVKKKSV